MLRQGVDDEVLVRRDGVRTRPGVQLRTEKARYVPLQKVTVALDPGRVGIEGPGPDRYLVPAHVLSELGGHLSVDRETVEVLLPVPHEDGEALRRELPHIRRRVVRNLLLGDGQRYTDSCFAQDLVRPHVRSHDDPVGVVSVPIGNDLDPSPTRMHGPDGGILEHRGSTGAGQGYVNRVRLAGVGYPRVVLVDGPLGTLEMELRPAVHQLVRVQDLVI